MMIDKQRVKQRYNTKLQTETNKNKELKIELRQQREHLQVITSIIYLIFFSFLLYKIMQCV